MDNVEDGSKKSLGSSLATDFAVAATGYNDYKKNKAGAVGTNKKETAKKPLSSAENSATKPITNRINSSNPINSASSAESSPGHLFTGSGVSSKGNNGTSVKKALPLLLVGGLILGAIALIMFVQPLVKIGTISSNLSNSLGFNHSIALLEKKCGYVVAEMAMKGKINENFYTRLLANNIDVGQVAASGDFVETNTYLAYLDKDIAATSEYQSNKTGELSFRFNDKIISAGNFVAAVESDPVLYAAFSKALNVSSEYHYSEEVKNIYSQLDITRSEFVEYKETSDDKTNYENFSNLVTDFLDEGNDTTIQVFLNSHDCRTESGDYDKDMGLVIATEKLNSGESLVSKVRNATSEYEWVVVDYDEEGNPIEECLLKEDSERENEAAALLNTAISSLDPYMAAKAFMVVAEPIQQAQAGDNGAVNQLMNMLDSSTSVEFTNIDGGTTTTKESIMDNSNFLAAITFNDNYDTKEAASLSRDSILNITDSGDLDILYQELNTATPTQQSASRNDNYDASKNKLDNVSGVYNHSVYQTLETFTSTIGANKIVEGGAFLNNAINSIIGSFASDSATVAKYQDEAAEIFARQAAADRATLSPFDISSKNTFLGSIVHDFATFVTYHSAGTSSKPSLLSIPESVADMTKKSIASITGLASADNYEDGYLNINGEYCETINSVIKDEDGQDKEYGLVGDIYCTEHKTIDTTYIDYTLSDFANSEIGEQIDHETGEITNSRGTLLENLVLGADRNTSVGVKNSEICNRSNDFSKFFERIYRKARGLFGVSACEAINNDDIAVGTKYTLSNNNDNVENVRLASAYALYGMANKIVGNANQVDIAREAYYEKHPLDNSKSGYIARISGMTKEEAEIAIAYANYLSYLANYDPSTRYSFVDSTIYTAPPLIDILDSYDDIHNIVYVLIARELTYADTRNRSISTQS